MDVSDTIGILNRTILSITSSILPLVAIFVGLASVLALASAASLRFGSFRFDFVRRERERIKEELEKEEAKGNTPQNTLSQEYHAQGLSQSRISFWFSLLFASFGFAIIALSVGLFLQGTTNPNAGWIETAGKPIFALVAGTVIDAVAALFFVQSNKSRQLMTEFFDKLRIDRKLDEALKLMSEISDPVVSSRVKGIAAMSFSDVEFNNDVIGIILNANGKDLNGKGKTEKNDGSI